MNNYPSLVVIKRCENKFDKRMNSERETLRPPLCEHIKNEEKKNNKKKVCFSHESIRGKNMNSSKCNKHHPACLDASQLPPRTHRSIEKTIT